MFKWLKKIFGKKGDVNMADEVKDKEKETQASTESELENQPENPADSDPKGDGEKDEPEAAEGENEEGSASEDPSPDSAEGSEEKPEEKQNSESSEELAQKPEDEQETNQQASAALVNALKAEFQAEIGKFAEIMKEMVSSLKSQIDEVRTLKVEQTRKPQEAQVNDKNQKDYPTPAFKKNFFDFN